MYKKGDILRVSTPEALGGFDYLMFTEDAVSIHQNPLKYMGAARPVCEDYLQLAGQAEQKLVCRSCRHQCAKKKYRVKYVGAFASEDGADNSSVKPQPAPGATVNRELDELLHRRKASAHQIRSACQRNLAREQALLAHQASVRIVSPFLMQTILGGHDQCEDVPVDYVVLENVEGQELRNYIAVLKNMQDQREADRRRLDLMRQLLYAVRAYAKQYSAIYNVHRDLKPENIMVHTYGENNDYQLLKLLDFDMLVAQGDIRSDDLYMGGTKGYVHPEAFHLASLPEKPERQFSHRWDLYAVGLIMYEIMEGYPHFEDDSYLEDIERAYELKPMSRGRDYPGLEEIIRRLIADQGSYYEDIDHVIEDYQHFLEKINDNWYADYYMDHWLECRPGYERNLRFANVYCKVSSRELKDCRQSFCVSENTAAALIYGVNIFGYKNAVGGQTVQKTIGSFYYIGDRIQFMPLSTQCRTEASDVDAGDRTAAINEGDKINYMDVEIEIEKVDYYD